MIAWMLLCGCGGCCIPQKPIWGVSLRGVGDNLVGDGATAAIDSEDRSTTPFALPYPWSYFGDGKLAPADGTGFRTAILNPVTWGTRVCVFYRLPEGAANGTCDFRASTEDGTLEAWLLRDSSIRPAHDDESLRVREFARTFASKAPAERGQTAGASKMSGAMHLKAEDGRVTLVEIDLKTTEPVAFYQTVVDAMRAVDERIYHVGEVHSGHYPEPLQNPKPARLSGTFTGHWIPWCRPWPFI
ncbi:MAG TPA: hypothetical protein VH475_28045 [Tepidisphaeraceae bacterium]|jgi:hypothetical protein